MNEYQDASNFPELGVDWITMGNCNGKSQSPIDFDFAKMTKATYDDFDFIGYDRAGTNDTLVNDAHCIMAHSNNNPLVILHSMYCGSSSNADFWASRKIRTT